MKICKTCQQQLSDEFVYCPKCGSELILDNHIICSKCNRSVDKEFAFCPYCGNKIISSNTILEKTDTRKDSNSDSEFEEGMKFYFGEGVQRDYSRAFNCFTKAANNDNDRAQFYLGVMYDQGQAVSQDYSKARVWFEKSAEQGNADAQYNLAAMYYNGYGVTKDYSKAAEWLEKSAKKGDKRAQARIGEMYFYGKGLPQDYSKAAEWLQKSAEQGDADAQYNLGFLYENGLGVAKDYSKAAEWFEKSAEQGDADAQLNLAVMYYKSAEQGEADAQYYLGSMYENGLGVAKDNSKAEEWYKKSAEQGHEQAKNRLNIMSYTIKPHVYISTESPFENLFKVTDEEMNAFGKICKVAEHGVKYDENWKALGYKCPKDFFSTFSFNSEKSKKAKIIYDVLMDCIIEAGLHCIGIRAWMVECRLRLCNSILINSDIANSIQRLSKMKIEYNSNLPVIKSFQVSGRFIENGLSTQDAERLEGVLAMIQFSYAEIFSDIFKDFPKRNRVSSQKR